MSLNWFSLTRVHTTLLEFYFFCPATVYWVSTNVATTMVKCTVHIHVCHGLTETVKALTARMLQFRSLAYM